MKFPDQETPTYRSLSAFYVAAGLLLALLLPLNLTAQVDSQPNVIFLMADDLGPYDLGAYGQQQIPTPNTDRLAREGILFTNAYSPSAICSPSRYGLLTGIDPFRQYHTSHVLFNGEPLVIEKEQFTVASLMKEAGYVTGVIGKWHLGLGDRFPRDINHPGRGPNDVGFDHSFIVPDGHNMMPRYYIKNGTVEGGVDRPFESEIEILDRVGYKLLRHRQAPGKTWDNRRSEDEISSTLADEVDQFIETNRDQPFFLYYPTTAVHFPYIPDRSIQGKSGMGPRGDFVMEFDWIVGRVMKTLERLNLTENTLFIVTSDNGGLGPIREYDFRPSHPWRGSKTSQFEGGNRIPFLARWPGKIESGTTSDVVISLVDLAGTLSDLTGIPLEADEALDSFNFLPPLLDSKEESEIRPFVVTGTRANEYLTIRQGSWKLILNPEKDQAELYNLQVDPTEKNDLSHLWPDRTAAMKTRLMRYIEKGSSRPGARGISTTFDKLFAERERRNSQVLREFRAGANR